MSRIALEASVAVKLYFTEPDSERAANLLVATDVHGWRIAAPVLLRSEMTNAIRRHIRSDRLPVAEATAILDAFLALPITYFDEVEM